MGSIVACRCQCGYTNSFALGGGFDVDAAYFPYWCEYCADIVVHDMKEQPTACRNCGHAVVSYSAPGMSLPPPRRGQAFSWNAPSPPMSWEETIEVYGRDDLLSTMSEAEWRDELDKESRAYEALDQSTLAWLHVGKYFCPQCRHMELTWEGAGCWD